MHNEGFFTDFRENEEADKAKSYQESHFINSASSNIKQKRKFTTYENKHSKKKRNRQAPMKDRINSKLDQVVRNADLREIRDCLDHLPLYNKVETINQLNDEDGLSALHITTRGGDIEASDLLLRHGADVNLPDVEGRRPIHYAAKFYKKSRHKRTSQHVPGATSHSDELMSKDCLKILIDNGAEVNALDSYQATPLHYACEKGHRRAVEHLLASSAIVLRVIDDHQSTPLHEAAGHGHVEIVKMLLSASSGQQGAYLMTAKNENGSTALLQACREGYTEVAKILLETANSSSPGGALMRMLDRDSEQNTALHAAIESEKVEIVKYLLDLWDNESESLENKYDQLLTGHDKFVDLRRVDGFTALHLAADNGSLEMIKLLIDRKPDINCRTNNLTTPLFLASQRNHNDCVQFLLSKECDPEIVDSNNLSPLLEACKSGHTDVATTLVEHGADTYAVDIHHRNCLFLAAQGGNAHVIEALLKIPACAELIGESDRFGNTALHESAAQGHLAMMKLLVDGGLRLDVRNDFEQTPLHIAATNDRIEVVRFIVTRDRSTLNDVDEHSRTPLHLAAFGGHVNTVAELIKLGANTEDIDVRSWTSLHMCTFGGWIGCAKILLDANSSLINRKTRSQETALHLACTKGMSDMVELFLENNADVTARLPDGRNALDVATDNRHEKCAVALVSNESWLDSMKNVTFSKVPGIITTPLRRLIENIPDVAELVLTKCMTNNGARIDSVDYEITFNYELLEDMYEVRTWNGAKELDLAFENERKKTLHSHTDENQFTLKDDLQVDIIPESVKSYSLNRNGEDIEKFNDEQQNKHGIYDENGKIKKDVQPYCRTSSVLSGNHPMKIMVATKEEKLLKHPVVVSLLNYKWQKYGRYLYWSNFLTYILYLVFLNVYMLSTPPRFAINETLTQQGADEGMRCARVIKDAEDIWGSTCQNNSTIRYITIVLVIAFSAIQLGKEVLQMIHQRMRYFIELSNYLELSLYSLSILVFVDTDDLSSKTGIRQKWQWECGAFAVLFSWMNLLLYLRRTTLGIYVFMVSSVAKSFFRFSLVMIFFLLGFSFSFYVVLQNQYPFYTPITTCVKTFVMMIGEMDYSSVFLSHYTSTNYHDVIQYESSTYAIFVIFVICMSLLVTNLLVGIAVDDIAAVYEQATLRRFAGQVEGVLDMEYAAPAFFRRRWVVRKRKVRPNKYASRNILLRWLFEEENMDIKTIRQIIHPVKTQSDQFEEDFDTVKSAVNVITSHLRDVTVQQDKTNEQMKLLTAMISELSMSRTGSHRRVSSKHRHEGSTSTESDAESIEEAADLHQDW